MKKEIVLKEIDNWMYIFSEKTEENMNEQLVKWLKELKKYINKEIK